MHGLAPPALDARFLEPAGFQWGVTINARNQSLRWGHLPAVPEARSAGPGATRSIVIVGGFGEFIEKYFETIRDFSTRGYAVWCLDWYGQGDSARPESDPTRPLARDFAADADDLAAFAAAMIPTGPRILVAHSMGGAIGLYALSRHPQVFTAAVLSAPMLGLLLAGLPRWLATAIVWAGLKIAGAAAFAPGAGRWTADPALCPARSHVSNDPRRCLVQREWYTAHPRLRVDGATYGWLQTALGVTDILRDRALLARVTVPVLIGSAGRDVLVSPRQHETTAKMLPDARVVHFPEAKHELFMETDAIRESWFSAIDEFLNNRLPA